MAVILLVGRDLEEPRLKIVRAIPWGDGYRYLIAEGPASPELYLSAFKDTCAAFPDCPVLVVADWGNHCEVLDAQHYTALRPVLRGT
jgi:hypothetical protein